MYDRMRLFGGMTALVLLGSVILTLILSARLQAPISRPILMLADTARIIAERKDYSVRAVKEEQHELGILTDAFNQMLTGIEEREKALAAANQSLRNEIAERKQVEEIRAQLAAIVESSDDAIISKTLSGIITSWNWGAQKLFGYTPDEAIGQPMLILFPPEEAAEEPRILARIARGENVNHFATVRVSKSGRRVDVSVTTSPVKNAEGQIIGASTIARDITEQKLADQKIESQLARLGQLQQITRAIAERQDVQSIFQAVVRSLEDQLPTDFTCICLYDGVADELVVTRVGVRSEALALELAMTEQSRIGIDQNGLSRCIRGQLVYEPAIAESKFPFPQRLAQGGLNSLVMAPLLVESKVFGVLIAARVAPESFNSNECEFLRQLSEHVALAAHQAQLYTALQQAYDDLRQTQQGIMQQERLRALGQMASGIAHDINNAISPVSLYLESLLEKETSLTPQSREYLQIVQRAIDDVALTVARMREFYRERDGQLGLNPTPLNRIVDQTVDLTRARWHDFPQQRGIVVAMNKDLAPDLPLVLGMENEIREALTNLIFNAVDAMPEGGTVTIHTGKVERSSPQNPNETQTLVHLDVTDTGVGMDEETRRRCLEPFFTTKGERGTGLGLAMVYGFVQRHNADIEIISAPGRGTTIRLIFSAPANLIEGPAHSGDVARVAPMRLLVVDDDPVLLKSLRDTLQADGHTVVTANGGRVGIELFQSNWQEKTPFDAVITDLGMPYVDGNKVADAIKSASPYTPVILLTGWGQRLASNNIVPPHVDFVLNKPIKLRDLREILHRCDQFAKVKGET
jgi:PAS domain S-box-containing protein